MLKANFNKYKLRFIYPAATSRGVMKHRDVWFVSVFDDELPKITGVGEIAPLPGLSIELNDNIEFLINRTCEEINQLSGEIEWRLQEYPALRFGFETALMDLENNGLQQVFPSGFSMGHSCIQLNGLIWMGNFDFMLSRIENKINQGFQCIKIKIGALKFSDELKLLQSIRKNYGPAEIEIRLDANGAFSSNEAYEKLKRLSEFKIHSIEQPIKAGQWQEMASLCDISPIPIALDEELIGINKTENKRKLLHTINPHYLIIKPSLTGGFVASEEWIDLAEDNDTGWWATSALESNLGLNAIAQWVSTKNNRMPQGLGTGKLFSNNLTSPLKIEKDRLCFDLQQNWDLSPIYD
ncbi:MAG: o-succinylbenzoate synthase [Bacteroidota bacterium]|nr:o-succinylbenzoate synthase [Bacteroidota bacterium]